MKDETAGSDRARKITSRIRGNFDRAAGDYARFESGSGFFRTLLGDLVALGPSLSGARVLDVGCGTGASLDVLADLVGPEGRVCGVDVSLGMLRQARASLGPRAALAAMDGCRFGNGFRGRFDAVVYNAVLFMLPDAAASLDSAGTVLEPGGSVLISSLEGLYLDGRPFSDFLADSGHGPGTHAVSPWRSVEVQLRERFEGLRLRHARYAMTPERFEAFYGLEPMSAGLLPRLEYPARREVVGTLARRLASDRRMLEQRWTLAWARTPAAA